MNQINKARINRYIILFYIMLIMYNIKNRLYYFIHYVNYIMLIKLNKYLPNIFKINYSKN